MLKSFLKRLISPKHLWRAYNSKKTNDSVSRSAEDPQLKLYDKILQTDFLHYGYFDDPDKKGGDITFNDIRQAQIRYAELIMAQLKDISGSVLDVGCGMGGLIRLLLEKDLNVVGITPDRVQVGYIAEKYPKAKLIQAKFQDMKTEEYKHNFNTIINSESLQYINLDKAIENVLAMLKPGGRWIVVDYFRMSDAHEKSGHNWDDFLEKLKNNNLKIVYEQDISPNIRPTLEFIHMWGNEIGRPIIEFLVAKLKKKHPGKHYLLNDVLEKLDKKIDKNLNTVNPEVFAKGKKYILLSIEHI